jgi:hypothetical protein
MMMMSNTKSSRRHSKSPNTERLFLFEASQAEEDDKPTKTRNDDNGTESKENSTV